MPKFSETSKGRLLGCHPDLIRLMNESIKEFDFAIICGYRNERDQNAAYNAKRSKLKYPNSKHNLQPSMAVDIAPVKYNENGSAWIDWDDIETFNQLITIVKKIAKDINIDIECGADWKMRDYPHIELKE